MSSQIPVFCLYVPNISRDITRYQLRKFFEEDFRIGKIERIDLTYNKKSQNMEMHLHIESWGQTYKIEELYNTIANGGEYRILIDPDVYGWNTTEKHHLIKLRRALNPIHSPFESNLQLSRNSRRLTEEVEHLRKEFDRISSENLALKHEVARLSTNYLENKQYIQRQINSLTNLLVARTIKEEGEIEEGDEIEEGEEIGFNPNSEVFFEEDFINTINNTIPNGPPIFEKNWITADYLNREYK